MSARLREWVGLAAVAAGLGLTGCAPSAPPANDAPASAPAAAAPKAEPTGPTVKLTGSGASFPAPLYQKWFKDYNAKHPEVQVDYQSIGSGGGVKAVIAKTVDFGASDAAMKDDEIKQVDVGVQLLPMTAGSIVLAYNLEGVTGLKLSRDAYVGIFSGKIKKWNDPAIAKTNEGAKLPDTPINVVVRSDGSGTSYVFTKHLSTVSSEFSGKIGTNKLPNWPEGFTKSKGNEGVTASLKSTPGAIGYVEYGYAKGQSLTFASLQNKAGKFVEATPESGAASLAAVKLPDNLIGWASDPEGDACYPIVTFTWVMVYKKYTDAAKWKTLKEVLDYALTDGQKDADALGYIPLPAEVVTKAKAALDTVTAS